MVVFFWYAASLTRIWILLDDKKNLLNHRKLDREFFLHKMKPLGVREHEKNQKK